MVQLTEHLPDSLNPLVKGWISSNSVLIVLARDTLVIKTFLEIWVQELAWIATRLDAAILETTWTWFNRYWSSGRRAWFNRYWVSGWRACLTLLKTGTVRYDELPKIIDSDERLKKLAVST